MENIEYVNIVTKVLMDKLASDIKIIDIREKATFADYFVLATGSSDRQINNLVDYIEDELAKYDLLPKSVEGKSGTGWILMDFGDIVVNLFTDELREKYNLEKVWGDCPITVVD